MADLELSFPHGLITKVTNGEFTLLTDYPEDRGGNNVALNPWRVFLAALLSCHGVNLAKYCQQHQLDYSQIRLSLTQFVEDVGSDPCPEFHIHVTLPENFPPEHIAPMTAFFSNCPIAHQLTRATPILKTFVNQKLISEKTRKPAKN